MDGHFAERQQLRALLGNVPPCHFAVQNRQSADVNLADTRVEQLQLQSSNGQSIRAFLTGPKSHWHGLPAVLYCHAHGNRYAMGANELIEGRPMLLAEPYGQVLAREGIVALSIDMPCFGERTGDVELTLAKKLLFKGQTLFGQMLAELGGALAFLATVEGVDPNRLGVLGFSMGATHAFWLGALETNLRAVAHVCSFADLGTLVASGAHDLHGIYMTVPGLLEAFSTGEIAGLIAPRAQLACMGLLDPLTPPGAVETALAETRTGYEKAQATAQFRSLVHTDSGHIETEAMRREIVQFFKRAL
ncbi:MAG: dienelactone hydrolase family protein [Beijerinckiaceae bacterium]